MEEKPVCLLFWEGKVALRRRPERGLLAGVYEYPESFENTLHTVPEYVGQATHIFTHKEWNMAGYAARSEDGSLPEGCFWADLQEWRNTYSIPSAFGAFAPYVEKRLIKEGT